MRNFTALEDKQEAAPFLRGISNKYRLVIFQNSPISLAAAKARDILVNFEISLAVFIPNTPRNRVISYTNHEISSAIERFSNDFLKFINNSCRENKGSQYREGGLDM